MFVSTSGECKGLSDIDARFLYVQPGQTLHNIVSRLYPGQEARWAQLRREIVQLNPSSFINGKEAGLKAGVRLILPSKDKPKHTLSRVGDVVQSQGHVVAVGADKVTRKLAVGDGIYVGDKLITGEDGFLRLNMIDHAKLDMRCFTIMVIEEYALKKTDRRSILKLLQGSIHKISGEIGKMTNDIYELQTPVASIGVRGTEYALRVFQSKGCGGTVDTDDGLFLQVIKGLVDVTNNAASTVVAKGNQLYIPLPDAMPVARVIPAGVLEPVAKPVDKKPEVKKEETSWWWYVLGVALIAAAL
jgi:hypothetical protein